MLWREQYINVDADNFETKLVSSNLSLTWVLSEFFKLMHVLSKVGNQVPNIVAA